MKIDLNRLSRFLTIAQQSHHDGERLTAFAMACKMLAAEKLTFADLLLGNGAASQSSQSAPRPKHKQMLEDLLDGDDFDHSARTLEFLQSLRAGLRHFGSLTPKQAAALEKIHARYFDQQ